MKRLQKLIRSCLPLLLAVALLAGNAQAALLEVGPTVPQVIGSTEPNLGHGYPAWYRDSNRVPLELCMNEAMCFFAPPDPTQAVSFPGNIPDELFYWAAESITPLASGGQMQLTQALEAAYSTGGVVPGAQITFARMRIRIDVNVAGNYVVTTPFKQYTFNNVTVADGINFTEDIGIGADGVFTGALAGTPGPFLYCADAPFPATDGSGGLYIGKNALTCPVLGSPFTDPVTGQPANFFRVQGPPGFGGAPSGTVQSNQFSVQGKIYTAVTPSPLKVDKATYALDSTGLQVNVFATTSPISNQTGTGTFPLNFALGGAPSTLELSAVGIPTQVMTTNNPADGKFFATSGLLAATPPATVTVTNTADIPATVLSNVPLVDEVLINTAAYNPQTKVLAIKASSSDKVNAPALQAFLPGMTAPLGTLTNGLLNVTFPVIDTTVTPSKTYTVPTNTITVTSAKGGAATTLVSTFITPPPPAPLVISTATLANGVVGAAYSQTLAATGGIAPRTWSLAVGSTLPAGLTLSPAGVLSGTPTVAGTFTFGLQATDSQAPAVTTAKAYTVVVAAPVLPATGATLTPGVASPRPAGTAVIVTAAATGGDAGPYEYRFQWRLSTNPTYTNGRGWATTPTWTWNTLGLSPGTYIVKVLARHVGSTAAFEATQTLSYTLSSTTLATGATLTPSVLSPQPAGTAVIVTAAATGGDAGPYEYRFQWRLSTNPTYTNGRGFSTTPTWTWSTLGLPPGTYIVKVLTRHVGSTATFEATQVISYTLN